ncbi:flagellar hook protein FlgE [Escherichia coli]|uniref:Flagellar hook protein FlgE n=1 Tax=Escherichia coli TaxID=562 RepID=A0A376UB32_ECOLX|nr:flagellar hook protein FlgE [Escherichia coli]
MAAKTTTTASMQINLNSSDPLPTVTPFSASNADSYNKKGSVTVFDSQGNAHDMSVYFVKTGDNNWQVYTQDSSDPTGTAEPAMKLVFNANGVLTSNPTENITTGAINGADPATFSLSFLNSMQQNTGANNIVATTQNGYKPGDLVSYQSMMTVRLSATIPTNKHNCWGRLYWRTLPTTKVWHPKATTSGLRRNLLAWRCWGQPGRATLAP